MEELAKLEEERGKAVNNEWESSQPRGGSERIWGNRAAQNAQRRYKATGKGWMDGRRAMVPGVASNEMCTFLILNISSLQLIPVNMIAYRSQYGSGNPTAIIGPAIVATAVSTAAAVVFCKCMDRRKKI